MSVESEINTPGSDSGSDDAKIALRGVTKEFGTGDSSS
jgi:hypothetical protein